MTSKWHKELRLPHTCHSRRLPDGALNVDADAAESIGWSVRVLSGALGPFAWSLRSAASAAAAQNRSEILPDVEGLKTLTTVSVTAKPVYDIRFIGSETLNGKPAYHLGLRPLISPLKHNLRDLWVDPQNFDLIQARFTGSYADSPTTFTTSLTAIGPYRVVSYATWTYTGLGGTYACDVQIRRMLFPSSLPDWLFDINAYDEHVKAREPDYVGSILDDKSPPK